MSSAELRSTVFVGNVAVFCTEGDLHAHFATCGEVLEIRLAKSEDNAKHLSYGFIRYANVACAQLAMRTLNGSILCGRPLKVDKAQSRSDRTVAKAVEKSPTAAFNSASVHVTFISHQIRKIINEETLRFLFGRFGNITDVIITKHTVEEHTQKQSGYGFVHFPLSPEGIEAAVKMAEIVADLMIDDVNYKCKLSHDLEQRIAGRRKQQPYQQQQQMQHMQYAQPGYDYPPALTIQPQPPLMPAHMPAMQTMQAMPMSMQPMLMPMQPMAPMAPAAGYGGQPYGYAIQPPPPPEWSPAYSSPPTMYTSPVGQYRDLRPAAGTNSPMTYGHNNRYDDRNLTRTQSHSSSTFRALLPTESTRTLPLFPTPLDVGYLENFRRMDTSSPSPSPRSFVSSLSHDSGSNSNSGNSSNSTSVPTMVGLPSPRAHSLHSSSEDPTSSARLQQSMQGLSLAVPSLAAPSLAVHHLSASSEDDGDLSPAAAPSNHNTNSI